MVVIKILASLVVVLIGVTIFAPLHAVRVAPQPSPLDGLGVPARPNSQLLTTRGDCLLYLSEFYAVADRPLKSDNITAVVPLNSYYDGFAFVGLQTVAIHGASRSIFDAHPSIPIIGCQRPFLCSQHILQLSIQTSTPDFVVAATAIDGDSGGCFTEPGFTTVQTIMNPVDLGFDFYYRIVPVPNTTVSLACPPYNSVAMFLMDAISLAR